MQRHSILFVCALTLACAAPAMAEMPVVFQSDFSQGLSAWEPTDPNAWKIVESGGEKLLAQFQRSQYEPPYRSPFNMALIKDLKVGSFQLDADVRSTARDYGHRDVCVFFGHQDPAHFYYVHFGKQTDDHANQIFIVDGAPRKKISSETTDGTPWTDNWHHVRVVRNADTGTIEVYFDDMEKPAMRATDKTFAAGRLGLGTFDDTAEWKNVTVRAEKR